MPNHPGLDVSNKVCLVTGGTSGIGRSIALGFAPADAKGKAGSTNPRTVAAIKQELGAGHDAVTINVADQTSVTAAVDATVKTFGRLDVVVNAAGVIKRQPSLEMTADEFRRIVDVNLTGSFLVAQAAARVMKDQQPDRKGERGNVIFIASLNSYISLVEVLAYAASKSGVLGLVRGLANEWAQYGIRVNSIAPGVFPTDLNRGLIEGAPRGEWFKKHTPMGRFGDVEELVAAAVYLISPGASFTTGETLVVEIGRASCRER